MNAERREWRFVLDEDQLHHFVGRNRFILIFDSSTISLKIVENKSFRSAMRNCDLCIVTGAKADEAEVVMDEVSSNNSNEVSDNFFPTMVHQESETIRSVARSWHQGMSIDIVVLSKRFDLL